LDCADICFTFSSVVSCVYAQEHFFRIFTESQEKGSSAFFFKKLITFRKKSL